MKVVLPLAAPHGRLAGVAAVASAAEDDGFDGVSCNETASDPMLELTVAAGATSRVGLMTNILVAFARSPMTLATQARALQDYSGGRLILGLGSQVRAHIERRFSMPWGAPAARMAEYLSALEAIWSAWDTGAPLDFRGKFYTHTLMAPMFTPECEYSPPPVYLAGVGERMTEVAGERAAGFFIHPFSTERYLREVTLPALTRGRRAAGLQLSGFEVVCASLVVTGRDEAEFARSDRAVRERLAFYASTPSYRPVLALHGWDDLGEELHQLSRTADPDRWHRMGALIDDDVLATFALVGTPDEIGPQFVARFGGLATQYKLNQTGVPDPELARIIGQGVREAGTPPGEDGSSSRPAAEVGARPRP
ncbi:TIGR03617 family F420-dependent LLM class oxidoreductase [Jatrophihabitans sp.]|uniref:TIGR03617 family F420-dependent LLM class oxidoreductase n=1 Tax=Jatrophihabitans sp. TaxID=1932789 RepID=UPI0030C73C83|nr:Phthiodiolone/phenolphthiodiolone dimycocerosates ketoreductase [Jatrophihabitans sp.]